jgi:hypothetical protein
MKKSFLSVAVAALMFAACNDKENFTPETIEKDDTVVKEINTRQVTNAQAQKFSEAFAHCFCNSSKTISKAKEISRTLDNIQYVISEDNDTLMYILNYSNNQGYMILSANKEDSPVLALADRGNIDLKDVDENSPFGAWLDEKKEIISTEIKMPLDSISELNVWNDLDNDSCETIIEIVTEVPKNGISKSRNSYSSGRTICYPYFGRILKWGQGTGYNYNAKYKGACIGCPAVAIGMLCRKHLYPTKYRCQNMPCELPNNYDKQNDISLMFRDIADNIPDYNWGRYEGAESGAIPENILIGLHNIGYKQAQMATFNLSTVYQNLLEGKSVLLCAYRPNYNGGHIWFCDGYQEITYKITKTKKHLFRKNEKKVWYEYEEQLYMNWGWNGNQNGWYVVDGKWSSNNYTTSKIMYTNLTH